MPLLTVPPPPFTDSAEAPSRLARSLALLIHSQHVARGVAHVVDVAPVLAVIGADAFADAVALGVVVILHERAVALLDLADFTVAVPRDGLGNAAGRVFVLGQVADGVIDVLVGRALGELDVVGVGVGGRVGDAQQAVVTVVVGVVGVAELVHGQGLAGYRGVAVTFQGE